jgi:hypothetical protein
MRLGAMRLAHVGLTMSLLALTFMLAACGGAASSPHTQANAPKFATPTVAPVPHLNWRQISTPIDLTHGGVSMEVSPVNGRNAWICGAAKNGQVPIYRTQDAGATWVQISALALAAPQQFGGCSVIPDQNAANGVAVWFPMSDPNNPGPPTRAIEYYSADGGANWTALPQNWWINQVATSGGVTYTLVNDLGHQSDVNVFASPDHLTTWRSINPQAQETAQNPPVLWIAPTTSDALLFVNSVNQLYHSTDGGSHWTLMTAQPSQSPMAQLAVWRGASAGWLICGGLPNPGATQTLCSADLGKTWTARPAAADSSCRPVGLTGDGALYDVCLAANAYGSPEPYTLMRLPLGASAWTAVGLAHDKYITVTQSGQVWCSAGDDSATYVLDQLP